jgi:hypothetical protein
VSLPLYESNNFEFYSIETIDCAIETTGESIINFISHNKNNTEVLPYYFDCYTDISSLLQHKTDDFEKRLICSFDINHYNRIKERLTTTQACPICFNNIEDKFIVTSCCSYIFHYECLFQCFKENMSCPMCRLLIMFQKSCIVDSSLPISIKYRTRNDILIDTIKNGEYNKILIVDGINQLNILEYLIKANNIKTPVYTYNDKIQIMNKIEESRNEDKTIYIMMKYSHHKLESINLSNIDLLIVYDNYLGHKLPFVIGQFIHKRTKNLKILYLKTII